MKVTRTREIAAPVGAVWDLVSDPHSLPRWWPKVMRVEDVSGRGLKLEPTGPDETSVSMTSEETLRGLSRLGGPMLRGAARRRLDDAFDGMERALVEKPS